MTNILKFSEYSMTVLNCDIAIRCADDLSASLLRECYSAFLRTMPLERAGALSYDIEPAAEGAGWIMQSGLTTIHCDGSYDLVYEFEKDMSQHLQLLRPDLFFVHGAALSVDDRCLVISGASGSGKSSLAWFMCHNGFDYMSDELAPVNPADSQVEPYPHALCLKNKPLFGPELPNTARYTDATIHVPAYELPTRIVEGARRLDLLIYIDASSHGSELMVRRTSSAESAARLYANGLNQLSHEGHGLPAVARLSRGKPSYLLSGGSVEERAEVIHNLFNKTEAAKSDVFPYG